MNLISKIFTSASIAAALLCVPALTTHAAGQAASPKLLKESGNGKLYSLDGLKMVVLSGTFYEMGQQYGTLLGDEISGLYDVAIDKAFVKSGLFQQEELDVFADGLYKSLPTRQKELLRGIAAAAGIRQQKAVLAANTVMVQILARKKFGGNITSCTSGAVWGKYTADGKVLTVRDYDFPNLFRELVKDYGVLVVYKPTDGSHALAGLGLAGSISFIDAMNDQGLYIEGNNASDSAGLIMFASRTEAVSQINNILFDAADSDEFHSLVNSTRFSYPSIVMQADASVVRYYEVSTWDAHPRVAQGDPAIAAANQFDDPSWGVLSLPSPAAWYSSLRETTLLNLMKNAPGSVVDEKHLMSVLDIPFYNDDGTVGKGVAVLKKNPKDDEVTVWQVVTKPADRKIWIRLPTLSGWNAIDLNEWFK